MVLGTLKPHSNGKTASGKFGNMGIMYLEHTDKPSIHYSHDIYLGSSETKRILITRGSSRFNRLKRVYEVTCQLNILPLLFKLIENCDIQISISYSKFPNELELR